MTPPIDTKLEAETREAIDDKYAAGWVEKGFAHFYPLFCEPSKDKMQDEVRFQRENGAVKSSDSFVLITS